MGVIELSSQLYDALVFVGKFSSKVTISGAGMCSENILIEMPAKCDCEFTVRIKDLMEMLEKTREFVFEEGKLKYKYEIDVSDDKIEVERHVRIFDGIHRIQGGVLLMSLLISDFKVLSRDDIEITADKEGNMVFRSFGMVRTELRYAGSKVVDHTIDSLRVLVRSKDLRVVEALRGDVIFSFLDTHILVYSFERVHTVVVQIRLLVD
ncbi:hypothetical protein CWI42_090060 [Ordospora colligata]|uniref:Uncharacterized protein n=1 Tax=Ordospora colligata OC4 TaxID=1354746 RepID=A0A0B2UI93_9MICR|nr:uncharacterized protein M896_090060 [Ordospora colligata OC4]KHN69083.1 hypothetical protein M896_090060 [Ordospora colligata OC4]TBU14538.1 hypothetical protein CWI41_090060 [Ordospora colligata]TBU14732.1 hypothetical protein CWI40_090070 [Ordospora colligata]TBU18166.1 hypothetical protein CWI42_090060 [Ordospora colligata]